jgi:hypothetical protein
MLLKCGPQHGHGQREQVEGQMAAMINIIGPSDGKYIVTFATEDGRSLGLVVSEAHADVLADIQERIPYGLAVPDVGDAAPFIVEGYEEAKQGYQS